MAVSRRVLSCTWGRRLCLTISLVGVMATQTLPTILSADQARQSPILMPPGEGEDPLILLSGWIYESTPEGEPPVEAALVEVTGGGGYTATQSDASGFYSLSVRSGTLTVTASKEGHESRTVHFMTRQDTVLNFTLNRY